MLLSAALVTLIQPPATQINNSSTQEKAKAQAVQAEESRKAPTLVKEKEKALTNQPAVDEPETVANVKQSASELNKSVQDVKQTPQQGCERYRSLISQYDWDVPTAMAVMQAESSCNPAAYSETRDRGLMQINAVHAAKVDGQLDRLFDPTTNIRVAYSVYQSQGWNGWMAYVNGKHLKFL